MSAKSARMYWLHAVTPLHVGSGRGVGFIDLPIMREAATNWPYVPGSTFKGVLADENKAAPDQRTDDKRRAAFGVLDDQDNPETKSGIAGSLVFTDARLVCLPVRSLYGTFAWCTSQLALERLKRDLDQVGVQGAPAINLQDLEVGNQIRLPGGSKLQVDGRVYFEDLDFEARTKDANGDPAASQWASFLGQSVFANGTPSADQWRKEFTARFAIVKNDVFDFLTQMATEVVARIRLEDDTKIVKDGALWYEESLPTESILAGCVWCDKVFGTKKSVLTPSDLLNEFCPSSTERVWQLGGKASVGKGRVRCMFQS